MIVILSHRLYEKHHRLLIIGRYSFGTSCSSHSLLFFILLLDKPLLINASLLRFYENLDRARPLESDYFLYITSVINLSNQSMQVEEELFIGGSK
jgi:uncharacterized membrane protein